MKDHENGVFVNWSFFEKKCAGDRMVGREGEMGKSSIKRRFQKKKTFFERQKMFENGCSVLE